MTSKGNIEDRLAVRELLEQYADGVCQRDPDIWGDTWAEDSEWNMPHIPGMEKTVGRENIVKGWLEAMKLFPFVHMVATPGRLRFEGDTCYARTYTSEVAEMQDGEVIRPRGQYDDIIVKERGEWRFKQRSFKVLHGE